MKSSLTLTGIVDYGTIGDEHLCGEARFSDGKRYRFVIGRELDFPVTHGKPAVLKMALPYMPKEGFRGKPPEEQWAWGNDKRVFPNRAALIMAEYPEYLARAKVEKAADDAAYEVKRKAANEAALRERALQKAAPDLLAACQAYCNPSVDRQVMHDMIRAAITKATTIKTS